ncbi:hypothetical protein [Bdellovibrio sp. HCB2-146]|uniref:hypothetical protein n=1 Tax=Bdellovibrio sp. HCB2-146 TaxID=3394362 RepID=UPI0039BD1E6B
MNVLTVLVLLSWGLGAAAEISGPQQDKLIWVMPEWPKPSVSQDSTFAAKEDVFKKIILELQQTLPNYEHHVIRGHFDKAARLWKEGKKVCVVPILKTKERWATSQMTAFLIVPPYRVIVRNSQVPSILANKNSVSLNELFSNKQLKGGLIPQRSYSEGIDKILREHSGFRNWSPVDAVDWKTVLTMVKNERIDYTIEMAEFVRYFNKENPKGGTLVSLPIKELPGAMEAYIACNQGDWGKAVIKILDKKLQSLASTPGYQKDVETLFMDDGIKNYQESLQEFFKKRSEGPWMN